MAGIFEALCCFIIYFGARGLICIKVVRMSGALHDYSSLKNPLPVLPSYSTASRTTGTLSRLSASIRTYQAAIATPCFDQIWNLWLGVLGDFRLESPLAIGEHFLVAIMSCKHFLPVLTVLDFFTGAHGS